MGGIATLALLGLSRGAIRSLVALVATAGVAAFVLVFGPRLAPLDPPAPWPLIALGLLVFGAFLLSRIGRSAVERGVSPAKGWVSRLAGGALGVGQGLVLALTSVTLLFAGPIPGAMSQLDRVRMATAYSVIQQVAVETDRIELPAPLARPEPDSVEPPARPVVWTRIEAVDGQAERRLSGSVEAARRAPLSFEESGRVVEVEVSTGDRFEYSDVLARLDDTALRQSLDQAEANRVEAQAALAEAEADFVRQSTLFDRDVVAAAAVENERLRRDAARARLDVAISAVERAEDRLEDVVLRAPYAGRVAERRVEPSQIVTAGEPVFDIQGQEDGFEISFDVPETLLGQMEIGAREDVEITALRGPVTGVVDQIGARASGSSLFPVTLRIEDAPDALRAGMSAEVRLSVNAEGGAGLRIPATAVLPGEGDETHVFVHDDATGRLSRVPIEILSFEGSDLLVAGDGLDGSVIVTRGVAFLEDGERVELLGRDYARYDG
ncbi:efflux RND transporter periplasmic adaptor subunit [Jannaschia sp. Os4]|nr:efflux RND transporter periplasmic adaptor subunit [Jannaschia sp. Os4]